MRYLSIDLGDKRTGLAVGDEVSGIVTPVCVLDVARGDELQEAIARTAAEQEVDGLVVGLPVNMDGTEGDRARIARAFGEGLGRRTGLPIHEQDERLTSWAADQAMAGSGRTHGQKKRLRDALAAAEILRDFLATRKNA